MTHPLARVPADLLAGKSLPERVATLNRIAAPFRDLLGETVTWACEDGEPHLVRTDRDPGADRDNAATAREPPDGQAPP